jgi:hypothetical protein
MREIWEQLEAHKEEDQEQAGVLHPQEEQGDQATLQRFLAKTLKELSQ